jgi:hypothetical protein
VLLRKAGLLPAWVEPPPRPPPREPIPLDQLPPGALAPHLAPILEIARRHLNAEQLGTGPTTGSTAGSRFTAGRD